MKLSVVEQNEVQQSEFLREEAQKEAARKAAEAEAKRAAYKAEVIRWMAEESALEAEELQEHLFVGPHEYMGDYYLKLQVPEHDEISFSVERDRDTRELMRVRNEQFTIGDARRHTLGAALVEASRMYQLRQDNKKRSDEHDAAHERRMQERAREKAELGQYYLGLLEQYPILRCMLDVLAAYLEDREEFQSALENAEHWAEGTERIMGEKLQRAKAELERAYEDTRRVEDELRRKEDEYAEEQRRRERGW